MNQVAHYLQEHLLGEVTASAEARRYFAHDASILSVPPALIVYPRTEEDVRKTASFCWQLAERGQIMPITARGGGTNTSGAAIGPGIVMVMPAHMNKILFLDSKKQVLSVEAGATYDKVEQTLFTHGSFLPPYPPLHHHATIGGGIASNAVGEKSVKYGVTGDYTRSLRVVLANGEVIETKPLSRRELSHKMGLATLEGEIYRSLDKLFEENHILIEDARVKYSRVPNSVGYNLFKVRDKGHFDLTPLIVGSQGTLGVITEAIMGTKQYNPSTTLCLASLPELNSLGDLLPQILKLHPSMLELINRPALELVATFNPSQLKSVLEDKQAAYHLIIEFDDFKDGAQKKAAKNLRRLAESLGGNFTAYSNPSDQELIRKLRASTSTILAHTKSLERAVPVAEDVAVPPEAVGEFLDRAYGVYRQLGLRPAAWGHIGSGVIRVQPMIDLSKLGDRQKLFKVADRLYSEAMSLGGSISAGSGDGRIRAPYAPIMYGGELHRLMLAVKKIFDPFNILNPGVKTATVEEIKSLMRNEYSTSRYLVHLPRS